MMGWAFAALTYLAAAGVIGSLLCKEGADRAEYLTNGLFWPILYPAAILMDWMERRRHD